MRRKGEILTILPPLLQSEITALSTLAIEGPTNIYKIAKKAGKRYSLMFKAIKKLEKRNLIIFVEEKKTSKGTTANIYDLNILGILSSLQRELSPEDAKQWDYTLIRTIIRKYDNWLPLVFGKWSFFEKMNIERIALRRLKAIVERLNVERTYHLDFLGFGGPLVPLADIKTVVCWIFYFIGFFPINTEFEVKDWQIRADTETWINALKQDKDIVSYLLKELEFYQYTLRGLSDLGQRLVNKLIGTEEHEQSRG